jgi:lipopolysaccharide/colanic/teichoic acid biosynthesis glycosyltransferase
LIKRGNMSFVGPRSDMPEYVNKLSREERNILERRPGIIRPASLKYTNEKELLASDPDPQRYNDEVIWTEKVRINLDYYHNRSFLGDVFIILSTVFGKGRRKK